MDDDYSGECPYDVYDYPDSDEDVCACDCADDDAVSADDGVDVGADAWPDYDGSDACDGECANAFAEGDDEDSVEARFDDGAEASDAAVGEPWIDGVEEAFGDNIADTWIDGCEEAEASDNNRADPLIDDCEEAEASGDAYSDEGSVWFSDYFPQSSRAYPTAGDDETDWNHLSPLIDPSIPPGRPPFLSDDDDPHLVLDDDGYLFSDNDHPLGRVILEESETESIGSEFDSSEHIEQELVGRLAATSVVERLPTVMVALADQMDSCAVCTDEFVPGATAKLLPCTHRYHEDCILPWLRVRNTCPVCRIELPAEVLVPTHLGGGVYLLS